MSSLALKLQIFCRMIRLYTYNFSGVEVWGLGKYLTCCTILQWYSGGSEIFSAETNVSISGKPANFPAGSAAWFRIQTAWQSCPDPAKTP